MGKKPDTRIVELTLKNGDKIYQLEYSFSPFSFWKSWLPFVDRFEEPERYDNMEQAQMTLLDYRKEIDRRDGRKIVGKRVVPERTMFDSLKVKS